MSETEALINRAGASLAAASNLLRDGFADFSASRAYYAMFYVAEALLLELDQSYSSHAAVIGAFGREYAKTKKLDPKYHRWLISGQNFRNIGDYGVDAHVSVEQAQLACEWAELFIERAERLIHKESR